MTVQILIGDSLELLRTLPDESVQCCVTSPPYYNLRDYGVAGQMGLEKTPQEYIANMAALFREVKRVLKTDGTLWLNLGDSYSKDKNLLLIPVRVAMAMQDDGWILRQRIVWAKPNGMPSSVTDRCTSSHEDLFLFTKSEKYYSDFDAIKTPPKESSLIRCAQDIQAQAGSHRANGGAKTNGSMKAVGVVDKQRGHSRQHAGFNARWDAMSKDEQSSKPANMRDVWFISPTPFRDAHFATFPPELPRRCIVAGSRVGDTVLDPFMGAGTVGLVASREQRNAIGIELNPEYAALARSRIDAEAPMFSAVEIAA